MSITNALLGTGLVVIIAGIVFVAMISIYINWEKILVAIRNRDGAKQSTIDWPFYARKPLLSSPEQVLYFRLCEALPEHIILAQVQLSRILGVKSGNSHQEWLNRINRMSADFVVCTKDASVLAVIELDDSTHKRAERAKADEKKSKALSSAGVQLLRWNVVSIPSAEAIRVALTTTTN